MTETQQTDIIHEIKERRVLQLVGFYLGGAWVALEFTGFIADRYYISPYVIDLILLGVAAMLPSVITLAYTHGKPGKDVWTKADKIIIPVNIVITMALMIFLFGGKELGATTLTVQTEDESGATIERIIPKAQFRKSVGLFFFENSTSDSTLDWISHWLPYGLYIDLLQDLFFDNRHLYQMSNALLEGQGIQNKIPLALLREIARRFHLQHFLSGQLLAANPYKIETNLYLTKNASQVANREYTGDNINDLIDQISLDLKADLGLSQSQVQETADLPLAAISSDDEVALARYVQGMRALFFDSDWPTAAQVLAGACELDPTFAIAQFHLYRAKLLMGQTADESIETAMQYLYKVPERFRGAIKEAYYLYQNEPEKALSALTLDVNLFPDDVIAHRRLARFFSRIAQHDEALEQYRIIRELNPNDDLVLRDIAEAYSSMGNFGEALSYLKSYSKGNPRDAEVLVEMGEVYQLLGKTDAAAKVYNRALLLGYNRGKILSKQADLSAQQGEFDVAISLAINAIEAAQSPEVELTAYRLAERLYFQQGRIGEAMRLARSAMPLERKVAGPMNSILLRLGHFVMYAETTLSDSAFAWMSNFDEQLPPPWDLALLIQQIVYKVHQEGAQITDTELAAVEKFFSEYKYLIDLPYDELMGNIKARKGDHIGAIQSYISSLSQYPNRQLVQLDMARVYRDMGDAEGALATLEQLTAIYPNDPNVLYELYQVQLLLGHDEFLETLKILARTWEAADPIYLPAIHVRMAMDQLQPS
ncbi:tetratricopeptide repeat protein [Candidatus Neomarinimicrobiota bacterium]